MEPPTNNAQRSEEPLAPPRKPYHPPEVTLYGDLAGLTQQGPNPLGDIMPLGDPGSTPG
jgi:hypothetical protein